MFHPIEFTTEVQVDLETSRATRAERLRIRKGTRLLAQVKPYVIETGWGPVEVADLFFEDGAARTVPFACFRFVE